MVAQGACIFSELLPRGPGLLRCVRQWSRHTVRDSAACYPSACCRACAGAGGGAAAAARDVEGRHGPLFTGPARGKKRRPLRAVWAELGSFQKKPKAKGRPFALGKQPTEKSKLPLFLPPRSHSAHTIATERRTEKPRRLSPLPQPQDFLHYTVLGFYCIKTREPF